MQHETKRNCHRLTGEGGELARKRQDGRRMRSFRYEGKRYYVYGKNNAELSEAEARKRAELEAGTELRTNPTLDEYYKHFTEVRRKSVKESTIRGQAFQYASVAGLTIDGNSKKVGELKIRDITPKDMQYVQLALTDKGYTTETVNNIMAHVKHVFNAAVKDETIDKNPCSCIRNLQRIEAPARETIHRALSEKETEEFFRAVNERNSFYKYVFAFMLQTGMRVGEVGALTSFDIDEKEGVIHVKKTVSRDQVNAYILSDTTKTKSGKRDIPLTPGILEVVKEQRNLNRMMFFSNLPETLFPSPEGALLRDYSVDREIGRCCKLAGIDRITSHAFRATFATRFIEQRPEDFKALSEILGHKNVNITLDLYTHVMNERKSEAMNAVNFKMG